MGQLHGLNALLLRDNRLTDDSLTPLLEAVRILPKLTALDLSGNDMDDSAASLRDYLGASNCKLRKLWLAKADIDAAEWEGVPSFLRRLYDAGDDMVFMSKGFPAKENKAKAEALAKEFRATIRAVDRPAQAKDRDAVLAAYKATAANMATFLELSSDVPEEL